MTNRGGYYLTVILILLIIINSFDDRDRSSVEEALERKLDELEVVGNKTFGDVKDPVPKAVAEHERQLFDISKTFHSAHFYHNITGVFKGDWVSENITLPHLNTTEEDEARGDFAYDTLGHFTFNFKSLPTDQPDITVIEAHLRLRDDDRSDNGILLYAEGVHFLNNGSLFLHGVPDGQAVKLDAVLEMVGERLQSNETFQKVRDVLIDRVGEQVKQLKKLQEEGWDTTEGGEPSASVPTNCHFQITMQLHPVPPPTKQSQIDDYERELQNPTGISTIRGPPLVASMILYSSNCGIVLSASEMGGIKIEKYYSKAVNYAAMASVLALVQIYLLIHQIEFCRTQSSILKISYWTIAMQAVMDGYLCLLHLITGVLVESVFIPFVSAAFFNFVGVGIFGMRFLLLIYRIQRPGQRRTARAVHTNAATATANVIDTGAETAAAEGQVPAQAQTARPRNEERPEGLRDTGASTLIQLYGALLFGLFVFYQVGGHSNLVQNIIVGTLAIALFSLWIPQIVRNVMRRSRRGLSMVYVTGMSVTRLAIPLYFYGCPYNLLSHEPTPWVFALVAYVAFQVLVLYAQEVFGARFFVPARFLPEAHNYHPILPAPDIEAPEEPNELASHTALNSRPLGRDCAICMLPIEVSGMVRTGYMLTPCHHLFHTECLEQWMRIKLECPVCRSFLPTS